MIDTIVIVTYKQGYFLSRICVASIRYFYPDIDIYLVRDYVMGEFDSKELERAFNVKILDLGIQKFGWSAAKLHLLFAEQFANRKILALDNDVFFAGRFLEQLSATAASFDFVVDPDYHQDPNAEIVKKHYFKYENLKKYDPDYEFPGFVFNGGQMVVSPGVLDRTVLDPLFDLDNFPFYKKLDIFTQYDQSILNYLLPTEARKGKLKLGTFPMMKWSDSDEIKNTISLEKIKEGNHYSFLIHYAGVLRVADVSRMTRPDILLFFEDFYYKHVPGGNALKFFRRKRAKLDFHLRRIYRKYLK